MDFDYSKGAWWRSGGWEVPVIQATECQACAVATPKVSFGAT